MNTNIESSLKLTEDEDLSLSGTVQGDERGDASIPQTINSETINTTNVNTENIINTSNTTDTCELSDSNLSNDDSSYTKKPTKFRRNSKRYYLSQAEGNANLEDILPIEFLIDTKSNLVQKKRRYVYF